MCVGYKYVRLKWALEYVNFAAKYLNMLQTRSKSASIWTCLNMVHALRKKVVTDGQTDRKYNYISPTEIGLINWVLIDIAVAQSTFVPSIKFSILLSGVT